VTLRTRSLIQRRDALAYVVAVGSVLVAAVLRVVADPAFAGHPGFTVFVLPVALAAWMGGLGPGLVATALSLVVGVFLFVEPTGRLEFTSVADAAYAVTFVLAGLVVTGLAEALRRGRGRAELNAFRAERLQAVAGALSGELSARETADAVLREGIQTLGAGSGVVCVLDETGTTLSILASAGYDRSGWGRWEQFPVDGPYPVSEAVRLREPVLISTTEEYLARYPDLAPSVREAGSALVLPLLDKAGAIGGVYYRFADTRSFGPEDAAYLSALGQMCAAALERARLHDRERRSAERSVFLARASALLASSLDVEATVDQVAALAVPTLADYCSVHLLEPDGSIRTLALAGDPEHVTAARRFLQLVPPRIEDEAGIGSVVRTGTVFRMPSIPVELIRSGIPDPEAQAVMVSLRPLAHVTVPLEAHGRTRGALALTTTAASGRRITDEDVTVAQELASRAAFALENADLYHALGARERQQAAVARLGQLALGESELSALFDATIREVAAVLEVDIASILQLRPDGKELRLIAGAGWPAGVVGSAAVDAGPDTQSGYTLAVDAPVIVADFATETRFRPTTILTDEAVTSGMGAVVHDRDGAWGVLTVHTRRARSFTEDDTNFLVAVTNVLGGAVDRNRRLEEQRLAQDLNRAFIGVVSHELRTPITSIFGGTKMLRRLAPGDPDRLELERDVEAEADRLYRLTEDLLVLTRLERHDLQIEVEPVLLNRLLERVIASEQRHWPMVEMALEIGGGLDPVAGEDSYVEQVARNLLSNAAKYSPAGTQVDVRAERQDGEVIVRVLDRGPGIRNEDPAQLFSLFYRSASTAQQASGAGIGLFVCEQLIRGMGGRLWARARDGGGSEFGFALAVYGDDDVPMDERPADEIRSTAGATGSGDGTDGHGGSAKAFGSGSGEDDPAPITPAGRRG
jgi:K+-sensing histidine kinase KdpD